MGDFKQLPPITCGALATATLMYPVDLVRALKMSAAAEGRSGSAVQLIKEFHAIRECVDSALFFVFVYARRVAAIMQ